jgi:plastocyanin
VRRSSAFPAAHHRERNQPTGSTVTSTVTASQPDDPSISPTITCSSPSGSTFPIGTTTVVCTTTDPVHASDVITGDFLVVVNQGTPPTLQVPATITVNATSPQGAVVTYTVTATNPTFSSDQLTITCSPPSGSIFPIGTTTVQCSTKDPAGNASTASFQVVKALPHRGHRCGSTYEQYRFCTHSITIKKGQSITLIGDTAVPHTIANGTWQNGSPAPAKESGAPTVSNVQVGSNQSASIEPFTTAGTFKLYCTIHPNMNLTVTVQ